MSRAPSESVRTVELKVRRCDGPDGEARRVVVPVAVPAGSGEAGPTVAALLLAAGAGGGGEAPPAWERGCLSGRCGSCAMRIDGTPALACVTRVPEGVRRVELEPLESFPVVKDLAVDRSSLADGLEQVRPWVELDRLDDAPPPAPPLPEEATSAAELDRCHGCGLCLEACPQVSPRSRFAGAAAVHAVRVAGIGPAGARGERRRLEATTGERGVDGCALAGRCERACPEEIPLVDSIAAVFRKVTFAAVARLFGR